jgi:hypothetical protein
MAVVFRILEFESTGIHVGGKEVSCEVELWDCSGDQKYGCSIGVLLSNGYTCHILSELCTGTATNNAAVATLCNGNAT